MLVIANRAKEGEMMKGMINDSELPAIAKRLMIWWDNPNRKPSNVEFTSIVEHHIASLMEYAARKRRAR